MNGYIWRLSHVIAAIEPSQKITTLADNEDSWTDTVHCNDLTMTGDGQSRHDIYVAYGDLLQKMTILGEDLHAGTFVSTVANYILSSCSHYGYFARIPELALVFPWYSELEFEGSSFLKYLKDKWFLELFFLFFDFKKISEHTTEIMQLIFY